MKLQDLDFRLYVVSAKDYVRDEDKYQILADLKAKSEFIERNALKEPQVEVEFFTGFYDKNGTKIYVGDIVHIKPNDLEDWIHFIDFRKDKGYFLGDYGNDDDWIDDDFCEGCCQVIGNIHENKELIDFMERQNNEWELFYKRKDEDWLDFLKQKHKDFVAEEEFFNKKYCDLETKLRHKLEQELKEILSRYL